MASTAFQELGHFLRKSQKDKWQLAMASPYHQELSNVTVPLTHFTREVCSHANTPPPSKWQSGKEIPNITQCNWRAWKFIKRLKTWGHNIQDIRKSIRKTGELVQPGKCLLHHLEDLSAIPRPHGKVAHGNPRTGEAETGGFGGACWQASLT